MTAGTDVSSEAPAVPFDGVYTLRDWLASVPTPRDPDGRLGFAALQSDEGQDYRPGTAFRRRDSTRSFSSRGCNCTRTQTPQSALGNCSAGRIARHASVGPFRAASEVPRMTSSPTTATTGSGGTTGAWIPDEDGSDRSL